MGSISLSERFFIKDGYKSIQDTRGDKHGRTEDIKFSACFWISMAFIGVFVGGFALGKYRNDVDCPILNTTTTEPQETPTLDVLGDDS